MATNSPPQTRRSRVAATAATSPAATYFQMLLGRLAAIGGGPEAPRALGVTSCAAGAGVSTVAANLAQTAAWQTLGQQTLLIDAHLDRPCLHQRFGADLGPGVAEVLAGRDPWHEAVIGLPDSGLFLLPAGGHGMLPSILPNRAAMIELLCELKAQFDLVIVDLPPLGQPGLAMPLAGVLDGVLLVVEAQRLRRDVAKRAKEALQQANAQLIGVALNKERYAPRSM